MGILGGWVRGKGMGDDGAMGCCGAGCVCVGGRWKAFGGAGGCKRLWEVDTAAFG